MEKKLKVNELAEVVSCLLIEPDLIHEKFKNNEQQYLEFVESIALIVAYFGGGKVEGVRKEAENVFVVLKPCDSLPSLARNVWSYHDTEAWVDLFACDDKDRPPSKGEVEILRTQIQLSLASKSIN